MKKTAPAKESGLEMMQPQFSRKARSIARVDLVPARSRMYRLSVTVNPVADLGRSGRQRRTSAHHPIAGAFFASAMSRYGGCARDTFGCAGFLCPRSANPRTAVSIPRLAASGDGSKDKGAVPMKHYPARNPSALQDRAAAHRAMALAALHSNSSLSVRIKRYNAAMARARALEAQGGAV